jgi:hypothetical protein
MADEMGTFRTDVEIANPAQPRQRELIKAVLVDTGAELSWFPASVLQYIGLTRLKVCGSIPYGSSSLMPAPHLPQLWHPERPVCMICRPTVGFLHPDLPCESNRFFSAV